MALTVKIDTAFLDINTQSGLSPIERKRLLSLINDFEDEQWRYEEFEAFIWDNVAETALTHRERQSALMGDHSRLRAAAKNLRLTDKEPAGTKGSEIAEIVLYGVMKHHFGALPVVPKIFYKQSANDYAKGSDSVHIVAHGDDFAIFFGEAKFFSSIENARLGPIIASVKSALATDKLKKENSIVTNLHELDSLSLHSSLVEKIRLSLSGKTSIDELKPRLHVPILLLHECAITNAATACDLGYLDAIRSFHYGRAQAYFERQVEELASQVVRYEEITFHLILIPVPNKEVIVKRFVEVASTFRGP